MLFLRHQKKKGSFCALPLLIRGSGGNCYWEVTPTLLVQHRSAHLSQPHRVLYVLIVECMHKRAPLSARSCNVTHTNEYEYEYIVEKRNPSALSVAAGWVGLFVSKSHRPPAATKLRGH